MITNNYGEPWKFNLAMDAVPIIRADGTAVLGNCEINELDLVRAVTCVNACADIPDPAAAIQAARDELKRLIGLIEPALENGVSIPGLATMNGAKLALKLLTPSKQ